MVGVVVVEVDDGGGFRPAAPAEIEAAKRARPSRDAAARFLARRLGGDAGDVRTALDELAAGAPGARGATECG